MRWTWRWPDPDGRVVTVDYQFSTGAKQISVDGGVVARKGGLSLGLVEELDLDGQPATVRVSTRWLIAPHAELEMGGRVVPPTSGPRDVPRWAWLFVAANLAILVVARGGAIPGALAGVGAVCCVWVSRGAPGVGARIGACAAITAAAWAALWVLVRALTG
jgi:hypothetical protein